MMRHWFGIPAGLALLVWAGSAQAAVVRPELSTGPAGAIVEKVHGTHRGCRYSAALDWHRHVGPYNRAVSCAYRYYDPFDYDPYWYAPYYGPGITFYFGDRRRYHRVRPHRPSVTRPYRGGAVRPKR
jgi:hypothetical protein